MSLVELLVVVSIIAVVLGLVLPATFAAREAARRMSCQSNLKQITLAVQNYHSAQRHYPPSFVFATSTSWSVHGRLLPYLEQSAAYAKIQLDLDWHDQVNLASGVQTLFVSNYLCPTDPHSHLLRDEGEDEGLVRPVNYGFNNGTWFVYDPKSGRIGDGCFHVNAALGPHSITDGLSNTLCATEVKSFQAYVRNTAEPRALPPSHASLLTRYMGGAQFKLGPDFNDNSGHVEWCDGPVHQSGFTSTFRPNAFVSYLHTDGRTYDIDFNSRYEGTSRTTPTYAAVTARSYHTGLVNSSYMDGSVHAVDSSIDLHVWRALSSRSGGEVNECR